MQRLSRAKFRSHWLWATSRTETFAEGFVFSAREKHTSPQQYQDKRVWPNQRAVVAISVELMGKFNFIQSTTYRPSPCATNGCETMSLPAGRNSFRSSLITWMNELWCCDLPYQHQQPPFCYHLTSISNSICTGCAAHANSILHLHHKRTHISSFGSVSYSVE